VLFFLILLLFFASILPVSRPSKRGAQMASWNEMKAIAQALDQYQQDHMGTLPHHFSELVPEYISSPAAFFMQSKYNTRTCVIPTNLDSHPELIDLFSPYSFIALPNKRILVWERPGMWTDNTMSYFLFPDDTHFSDFFLAFRSDNVTPEEFEQQFLHGFH
jgi:hypothetical protein